MASKKHTKGANYFKHDVNARHDPGMKILRGRHGAAGIGVYWCLVEELHEQGGIATPLLVQALAADLRIDNIDAIIKTMVELDLMQRDGADITNKRVFDRLDERDRFSQQQSERRRSVNRRTTVGQPNDAEAGHMPTDGQPADDRRSTNKESRVEESRVESRKNEIPSRASSRISYPSSPEDALPMFQLEGAGIEEATDWFLVRSRDAWKRPTQSGHMVVIINWSQDARLWARDHRKQRKGGQPHASTPQPHTVGSRHIPADQLVADDIERRRRLGLIDDDPGGPSSHEGQASMVLRPDGKAGDVPGHQADSYRGQDVPRGAGEDALQLGPGPPG